MNTQLETIVVIRIVALHIRSLRELIGGVVSQVTDSFLLQACNRTLSLGLAACWLSRQEKQLIYIYISDVTVVTSI